MKEYKEIPRLSLSLKVAQSCLTLGNFRDCSPPGSSVHAVLLARLLECQKPFPSPGDLPNPGIKPEFPALQADSLLSVPPRKHDSKTIGTQTKKSSIGNIKQKWAPIGLTRCQKCWCRYIFTEERKPCT